MATQSQLILLATKKRLTLKCSVLRCPSSVGASTGTDIPSPPPHVITLCISMCSTVFLAHIAIPQMGSKTTMLYLSPMETLQTAAMSWYLSHISLIISDTYSDHILCPGSLLCYVMSQITPQAKNIHCTFYGQFSQYATYVSIPILCCRQLGTRSKFGVQIPVEGVPV